VIPVDKYEFGKYLRLLRGKKSTRQIEMMTGVSKSYLSLIERGERDIPSPEILRKLAPAYKVSYEHLMKLAGYIHDNSDDALLLNEDALPYELKGIGIEELKVAKEIVESGFTAEEVRDIVEFAKKIKKKE